jgi:CHASE2 domain-containing sensor protein
MDKGPAAPDPSSAEHLRSTVARSSATTNFVSADFDDILGLAPDSVPGYTLLRRIGGGGQGDVYLALQSAPRRKVAIKIQREFSGSELADAARFEREIDVLARLRHPNIVAIHASGTTGAFRFYVMDYLSGVTLTTWLAGRSGSSGRERAGRPTIGAIISLFRKICNAIYAAHARGITHRDLKPENIRVDADGEPHILDFGLAKMSSAQGDASTRTISGVFIGSVPWPSPEQAAGENDRVDPRSDVYSLGVMLYHALTGAFPYSVSGGKREVLDRVIHDPPIPPRTFRPDLDSDLETILLQCLAKERERRYADAGELGADLARYQGGEPTAARRDSVAYLLLTRARRTLRHRPVEIHLGVQAGVVLAVYLALLLIGSTTLDQHFRRLMITIAPGRAPKDVRLIELRDPDSVERMATSLGIRGVRPDERSTHRALHGRLMKKLAESGAKVIVWDYDFPGSTDFDEEFAAGAAALRHLDPPVRVLAITSDENWIRGSSGWPKMSEKISASGVLDAPMLFDREGSWGSEIIYQAEDETALPGVALAAYAALQQPTALPCDTEFEMDRTQKEITIRYRFRDEPTGKPRAAKTRKVAYSGEAWTGGGWVGVLQAEIPPPAVLEPEVIEYESVFSMSASELESRVRGKALVIGDARPKVDRHEHPRYGMLPGCYLALAGLEALLSQTAYRRAPGLLSQLALAACLAAGWGVGWRFSRQRSIRVAAIVGLTGVCLVGSFLAYSEYRLFLNPTGYVLACLLSVEGSAWLRRMQPTWERTH